MPEDDVVWVPHGYKTLQGKDAFDADIVNEGFEGRRRIAIDRLIGEGDTVVCTGGADPVPNSGTSWSSRGPRAVGAATAPNRRSAP